MWWLRRNYIATRRRAKAVEGEGGLAQRRGGLRMGKRAAHMGMWVRISLKRLRAAYAVGPTVYELWSLLLVQQAAALVKLHPAARSCLPIRLTCLDVLLALRWSIQRSGARARQAYQARLAEGTGYLTSSHSFEFSTGDGSS